MNPIGLIELFQEINFEGFDGELPLPQLCWNTRLRASAGIFVPGKRDSFFTPSRRPRIDIAAYLLQEEGADELIRGTLAHEMIHYWLWLQKKPYGHTRVFVEKMKELKTWRYNPVPRKAPPFNYRCGNCGEAFRARKRLDRFACRMCCEKYSGGRFHSGFRLVFVNRSSS